MGDKCRCPLSCPWRGSRPEPRRHLGLGWAVTPGCTTWSGQRQVGYVTRPKFRAMISSHTPSRHGRRRESDRAGVGSWERMVGLSSARRAQPRVATICTEPFGDMRDLVSVKKGRSLKKQPRIRKSSTGVIAPSTHLNARQDNLLTEGKREASLLPSHVVHVVWSLR